MLGWLFRRRERETRASGSGFTAEIMAARESYISGRRGWAELTATAQSCISLWENGLGLVDVTGTELLTATTPAMAARSVALRGEAVFLIRETGLVPCSDWDLRTRDGIPSAYRVSVSEAGGGRMDGAAAREAKNLFRVASTAAIAGAVHARSAGREVREFDDELDRDLDPAARSALR